MATNETTESLGLPAIERCCSCSEPSCNKDCTILKSTWGLGRLKFLGGLQTCEAWGIEAEIIVLARFLFLIARKHPLARADITRGEAGCKEA